MSDAALERWILRISRAAELLAARLEDPPTLTELAQAASLSPYHFHRVWRALTRETVGETIRRLRIELSKERLLDAGANVTGTAIALGFATPQSFARAFRRETGQSPSEYQGAQRGRDAAAARLTGREITIEHRPDRTVIALRRTGKPYRDLNATFLDVFQWAERTANLERMSGIFGIPYDDPASVPVESLRYDACLALGEDVSPAPPFHQVQLPAGEYASIRHYGSYEGLEASSQRLIVELLSVGSEPANFPLYYEFLNDPDQTAPNDLLTDVLVCLAPSSSASR
jgi:AraC family transcriptional regulator